MGVIYLVRHGQASFGTADYDVLSDLGRRQSVLVGEELRRRGVRVDLAVSGTLRRQRDTALAALAALTGVPAAVANGVAPTGDPAEAARLESDSRWNEYDQDWLVSHHADVGESAAEQASMSSGISSRAFQSLLDVALADWMAAPGTGPGSFRAFADAVSDALDGVLRRLGSGGTAVVFSSGGPIATVVGRLLDLNADGLVALNRVMINGGITKIVSGRSGTSLLSVNEHSHIDAAGRELLSYR